MRLLQITLVTLALAVGVALARINYIDTEEDLTDMHGWYTTCESGYQENTTDFRCGFLGSIPLNLPPEDLNGEKGFWTGCSETCRLHYRLNSWDVGMRFRVYLQNASLFLTRNGQTEEEITGSGWVEADIDLNFSTMEFRMEEISRTSFAVIDWIRMEDSWPELTSTTEFIPPTIKVDTQEDMEKMSGWTTVCDTGYEQDTTDFRCGFLGSITLDLPPEDLNGEVGFWTGCSETCSLTYRLNPSDMGMQARIYLQNSSLVIVKDGLVEEEIIGTRWVETDIDVTLIRSVEFRLQEITRTNFAVIDWISIDRDVAV